MRAGHLGAAIVMVVGSIGLFAGTASAHEIDCGAVSTQQPFINYLHLVIAEGNVYCTDSPDIMLTSADVQWRLLAVMQWRESDPTPEVKLYYPRTPGDPGYAKVNFFPVGASECLYWPVNGNLYRMVWGWDAFHGNWNNQDPVGQPAQIFC